MRKKQVALLLLVAAIAVAASGCTGRTISITWEPNPVVLKPGQEAIEGKITVKTGGVLGSLYIDTIAVTAYGKDGDVVEQRKFEVKRSVPFVINVSHTEDVSIPVTYDEAEDLEVRKIEIVVTGDDPATVEIEVILEE